MTALTLGPEGSLLLIAALFPVVIAILGYLIWRGNPDNPDQTRSGQNGEES